MKLVGSGVGDNSVSFTTTRNTISTLCVDVTAPPSAVGTYYVVLRRGEYTAIGYKWVTQFLYNGPPYTQDKGPIRKITSKPSKFGTCPMHGQLTKREGYTVYRIVSMFITQITTNVIHISSTTALDMTLAKDVIIWSLRALEERTG